MVSVSVGSAEAEQASTIFLETLRSLLDWGRVRFEGQSGSQSSGASDGQKPVDGRRSGRGGRLGG